ncbi:hypothetical protein FGLOB1_5754 [Fusarium globosum]|uniref:Uncharacterized protein n=1 Tax=Fusarium globosum TaxID=78864 RepID=A0A8H6DC48_9HYPO|nr:hypothetical protein FGLOB1_5754 [Fusarium globosum]
MVLVAGATAVTVATNPATVGLFGPLSATATSNVAIQTIGAAAAAEGVAVGSGLGGAILALGEGACVGAGVLATGGSGSAGIALATAVGPLGWAIVGCSKNNCHNSDSSYTWDCWKPVVRDTSTQPSYGMALRDLATHQNVQSMSLDQEGLLLDNIFGERFHLTPVSVEGKLAFHASIVVS